MQKWLIVSNCQTGSLADSMRLMTAGIEVSALSLPAYQSKPQEYNETIGQYDRVIVHPIVPTINAIDLSSARAVDILPSVNFAAYHPDIAYMNPVFGKAAKGPMRDYQSIIVLAAYSLGLDETHTRRFFNGAFYERVGYMDAWEIEWDALVTEFKRHGYEIADYVRGWGRRQAFMYSINHPRIHCLYDVAQAYLKARGVETRTAGILPADKLTDGPCWPVYPEIAEAYGVQGFTNFKPSGGYRLITLEQFIDDTFALYRTLAPADLVIGEAWRPRYERVRAAMEG